MAIVDVVS